MLYMLAGRIFTSIDFIEVKNADKGFASEPKKTDKLKILKKIDFVSSRAFEFTFSIHFHFLFAF